MWEIVPPSALFKNFAVELQYLIQRPTYTHVPHIPLEGPSLPIKIIVNKPERCVLVGMSAISCKNLRKLKKAFIGSD